MANDDSHFNKQFTFKTQSKFGDKSEITLDFIDGLLSFLTDLQYALNDTPYQLFRNKSGLIADSRLATLRFFSNTVGPFYQGSLYLQAHLLNYIKSKLNGISVTHGGILVAESLLLFLVTFALIRFVLEAMSGNQEVIKLFAYIQPHELAILKKNCSNFIRQNLISLLDEKEKSLLLADGSPNDNNVKDVDPDGGLDDAAESSVKGEDIKKSKFKIDASKRASIEQHAFVIWNYQAFK